MTKRLSPLQPPHPSANDNRWRWGSLRQESACIAVSQLAANSDNPLLVIAPDVHTAEQWQQTLQFFAPEDYPILRFPDMETLPYDHFSPHHDIISDRLLTLYQLPRLKKGIIISPLSSLMQRVCPRDYLESHAFVLTCGEQFDWPSYREQLIKAGYHHVHQVMEHGEFSQRGSIVDLYPMGSKLPYRIDLFDDEVSSIRSFDPETQCSLDSIDRIQLLPAREYPLTDKAITDFRQSWRDKFSGNPQDAPIYQQISQGEVAAGIEYYLPLFFSNTETVCHYLPTNTTIILLEELEQAAKQFWHEVKHRHEQLGHDLTRPLCPPNELFVNDQQLSAQLKPYRHIKISQDELPDKPGFFNFATAYSPSLCVDSKAAQPLEKVQSFIAQQQGRVLFCSETAGRRETVLELLQKAKLNPNVVPDWQAFLASDQAINITISPLEQGVLITHPQIALITETQLFGEKVLQRRLRQKRPQDPEALIRNLTELKIGDPVVHIQHGVGRYQGLQVISTNGLENEYLMLQYEGDDKIYVPVSSLYLISRYTGADAEHAPLQKLGSKKWQTIKERTAKKVRDVAAELLDIHRQRQASTGFAFKIAPHDYQAFRSAFPFEETPDQKDAINTVIQDMSSDRCMDRLICGDVGFGKTEVAMQACFVATQNNKQVAILVPTTLLAEQHRHNFQNRFADWPVRIAALSRIRKPVEQKKILKELEDGQIDIIIGTHKLLANNIQFKDLGLLVVDEEHRFGVRQKERIKAMRARVDILTLTATPIPRTLNMALSGTRDLSIIATPPARRLSVKTFVHEFNTALAREAILRETMRGGQVYFLHNKVATINATTEKLARTVPEARIAIAHGQMRERDLEKVMSDFYHQKFNVLVCSTIIESGIDIPSANTIIINRADRFGLAQLHQLRGRVGRSHHQAYAYLFAPPKEALTTDAEKRLTAIAELGDLGAGFNLATHDLEIRGAGEMLGIEQSGHIHEVGFSLYLKMLEDAVKALKSGTETELIDTLVSQAEIDLGISTLFPENYIYDVNTRLTFYKRLASCVTLDDIYKIKEEVIDRFGLLPTASEHLFQTTIIQQHAHSLGITKIDVGTKYGYLHFNEKPSVNTQAIMKLIADKPNDYQLQGGDCLRFRIPKRDPEIRLKTVNSLLKILK